MVGHACWQVVTLLLVRSIVARAKPWLAQVVTSCTISRSIWTFQARITLKRPPVYIETNQRQQQQAGYDLAPSLYIYDFRCSKSNVDVLSLTVASDNGFSRSYWPFILGISFARKIAQVSRLPWTYFFTNRRESTGTLSSFDPPTMSRFVGTEAFKWFMSLQTGPRESREDIQCVKVTIDLLLPSCCCSHKNIRQPTVMKASSTGFALEPVFGPLQLVL